MAARGTPMSPTTTRPVYLSLAGFRNPTFGPTNVTVAVARTAAPPIASPVSASNPEGMSSANTGHEASCVASASPRARPVSPRVSPVPNKPSITSAGRASNSSVDAGTIGSPIAAQTSWFTFASPENGVAGSSNPIVTACPPLARCRATASPSPPLLPGPASTSTCPPASTSIVQATSAAARAAFSMRTIVGILYVSRAIASTARAWLRVRWSIVSEGLECPVRILLTNDDGIRAPGIVAMYRELADWAETKVVAPMNHESATGHGITISTPLLTQKLNVENTFEGVAVDGRPADCVKVAVNQIVGDVDLVVSGMNAGANVGINILYSGTVAAAIEAAFLGKPSVAVSLLLVREHPADFAWAAKVAMRTIRSLWKAGLKPGTITSINVPALRPAQEPAGVKVVRQCTRPWIDTYEKRTSPKDGSTYYWNNSEFVLGDTEADTDVAALRDDYVTVTPLMFDLTARAEMARLKTVEA